MHAKFEMNFPALIKAAAKNWADDNGSIHCAAIAYYTVFSVAPLLLISIAIAGLVFGEQASRGEIYGAIQGLIGTRSAQSLEELVQNAAFSRSGWIATLLGVLTSLMGASGVFNQLQQSLNLIWKVKGKPGQGLWNLLRRRLLSFSMVIVLGFILMVALVVSAALSALGKFLVGQLPGGEILWQGINITISLSVITLLFSAVFKILPDVQLTWRDVGVGAAVTAVLFDIGKFLIGLYLGRSSVSSAYGAAGSLVVILIWVFYATAILFFGAEFTRVYATRKGHKILPKPGTEWVSELG